MKKYLEKVKGELQTRVAELEQMRSEVSALKGEKQRLESELRQAREEHAARMERYKKYEALSRLDRFLEGKITHYVIQKEYDDVGKILAFQDTRDDSSFKKGFRLLTLFGDTEGNLEWRLNRYRDGSGSDDRAYPFCSLEEARAFVQSQFSALSLGEASLSLYYVKRADKEGFELPDGYREAALRWAKRSLSREIIRMKRGLEAAEKKLVDLEEYGDAGKK